MSPPWLERLPKLYKNSLNQVRNKGIKAEDESFENIFGVLKVEILRASIQVFEKKLVWD